MRCRAFHIGDFTSLIRDHLTSVSKW